MLESTIEEAVRSERENLHRLGTLFGEPLYLETSDADVLEKATKFIEKNLATRMKTDEEIEQEVDAALFPTGRLTK